MDFIKKFHFIQKFTNNTQNSSSLGRKKSKRSIFNHNNNDRLVSSNMSNAESMENDDEDDDEDDDYNSNTRIFHQKPSHAITITTTSISKNPTTTITIKSKRIRPTHQLYMHHQKNSSSTVQSQLLSLSNNATNEMQHHKQLSIAFEGKERKKDAKQQSTDSNEKGKLFVEQHQFYHKQEKSALRNPERVSFSIDY
jgi:hypothetical protein